ncbi:MAG: AAA family ATPase [Elusimicrobia bacterium CG1_02_63_36]|nr:MAG: AAA family ATPase [Elusimicrobia bacterium CG1_02_63_36]PIP82611.1 MAG: AAA family ATPase [Elusimicrobia bacterium CG22_combo_CG10-13_8_21_14_all_63_91]PJA17797.1 MAG: AAA family ATPase [Elusimicrobia bacterium CG_4_10_14_0_2_um_filter_63_34]PJB24268.1 MAG: AAA family ATPase [Elusimicrobia bacterium CG_4_9_14_3_um_filter_62_55]
MRTRGYISKVSLKRAEIDSFSDYPFNLPIFLRLDSISLHPAVTFFVGENGAGKSTLLEAIAAAFGFNPEGGSRNFRFSTRPSHSPLHEKIVLSRGFRKPKDGFFLRAESFYNVATETERLGVSDAYGARPLHEQSHGESFLSLVMNRFTGKGLYILDEPEAALSPTRQLALMRRIHDLVNEDSQFLIATHSPILMAYPNARILNCDSEGIRETAYRETEHYNVSVDFLNNFPARIKNLLE